MTLATSMATATQMMSGKKYLVVIVGPTGSGKTDLSIGVAEHFAAPIISTDSRQFYRGMPIGTAQPTLEQRSRVEHHLVDCNDVTDELNCGSYERIALERLDELFRSHDTVVAVGGSGLYVKALCEGMDSLPDASPELRAELLEKLEREGLESLGEQLRELDPDYYEEVDRCNPQRVLRAVEVCLATGQRYSSLRKGEVQQRPFEIVKVGIDYPREELYDRINRRVDMMVAEGLEAEARAMLPHRNLNALRTVGYSEMFDYFDGKTSFEEAVELIKRNSRRYAKRQMTWFRRDKDIRWFEKPTTDIVVKYLDEIVKK